MRWDGLGLIVGRGFLWWGGGCGGGGVGREIDLAPAAKSHCMCLSDREHYSQSPWINSPAAPHDPVAFFPQTNDLIHKQSMMGESPEHSILKTI